eukprot:4343542-Pyramimonas_sp.AAC.1
MGGSIARPPPASKCPLQGLTRERRAGRNCGMAPKVGRCGELELRWRARPFLGRLGDIRGQLCTDVRDAAPPSRKGPRRQRRRDASSPACPARSGNCRAAELASSCS